MGPDAVERLVQRVRAVKHDASSPLTAALGHVQLLLEDGATLLDSEVRESLEIVEVELRRLGEILRRLNDVRDLR